MVSPVILADGHTYEESAIKDWLDRGKQVRGNTTCAVKLTRLSYRRAAALEPGLVCFAGQSHDKPTASTHQNNTQLCHQGMVARPPSCMKCSGTAWPILDTGLCCLQSAASTWLEQHPNYAKQADPIPASQPGNQPPAPYTQQHPASATTSLPLHSQADTGAAAPPQPSIAAAETDPMDVDIADELPDVPTTRIFVGQRQPVTEGPQPVLSG